MIGKQIAHYKIRRKLGQGGMGVVYLAEDLHLERTVALKFLPTGSVGRLEKERFKREAKAAAALSHPNIGHVYSIEETDDQLYIAMEYIQGWPLQDLIQPYGDAESTGRGSRGLPVEDAVKYAVQIATALQVAHDKGIIHRDIKPNNILVTDDDQVKIVDFGLAKLSGQTWLTHEGTTLGTVHYMSPEQAQGNEVDHRTDLWSLGVVLYQMLTGRLPFRGEKGPAIIHNVLTSEPEPVRRLNPLVPAELERIVDRSLEKNPESRYSSAAEIVEELEACERSIRAEKTTGINIRSFAQAIRKPRTFLPAVLIILALVAGGFWYVERRAKAQWAREEALPEIERLIEASWRDYSEAYELAEEAERYIPNDPRLAELFAQCSLRTSVNTEPPGARIYIKGYESPQSEWEFLGISPIEEVRVPIGIFRWKMEKEGYQTVLAASSSYDIDLTKDDPRVPQPLFRVLDEEGSIPPGMIRVPGAETQIGTFEDFFIDKYEVRNRDYKEFIDSGGYRSSQYWKHKFVKDGKILSWEEAIREFIDQTSRPGPSTWQAGDYPEGRDDFPVTGISWYEAAAYADYAGKSLPTADHWGIARGDYTTLIRFPQLGGYATFAPFSNIQGQGPVAVGTLPGITPYGAFDMVGNVREWCWNETPNGKAVRGGAWNEPPYMFERVGQAPAFNRSPKNGFRCAFYPDPDEIPKAAFDPIQFPEAIEFSQEQAVPDTIFEVYKERFSYDKRPLNAIVELRNENDEDWILEKVSFDAAYGNERITAYLFLPRSTEGPYQTVIYFPGSGSVMRASSDNIEDYMEVPVFLSFIVKNGRAALYPVYKGTFERQIQDGPTLHHGEESHRYTEYATQLVKDFRRSVDYLETRKDINTDKLAYYGMSWGGSLGAIIPAIEDRLKVSVLLAGAFGPPAFPEAHPINYITRVKVPTLMLNGEYDTLRPYEATIKPMFDLLGTPDQHKKLISYKTDHIPPRNEFIKESLAWLDRYLGPVE